MVSVREDKIVLRSKRLNKEVAPRLSSTHNFSMHALPAYHFLCDLQVQKVVPAIRFSFGALHELYPFLPRVVYKNAILHPATWHLRKSDFEILLNETGPVKPEVLKNWREKIHLPRFVAVCDGDNELVIDLGNSFMVNVFIKEIRKKETVKLIECPLLDEDLLVSGPEGKFTNEFIFTLYKTPATDSRAGQTEEPGRTIKRNYYPGEEWLYLKLYCGAKTADTILIQVVAPFARELKQEGLIEKWFYIRYADPQSHLRLRFCLKDKKKYQEVSERINVRLKSFIENGLLWRMQADTYQRELERYGPSLSAIESAETFFCIDSAAVLQVLETISSSGNNDHRWLTALKSVDLLMTDFNFSLDLKERFTTAAIKLLETKVKHDKPLQVRIDSKYRDHRTLIDSLLSTQKNTEKDLMFLCSMLNLRSFELNTVCRQIIADSGQAKLEQYAGSYIHMNINRFFKSQQLYYEYLIYVFLNKNYKSRIALIKKTKF
jgi:thiopeptide-type bacteriocin biosynthesis protein